MLFHLNTTMPHTTTPAASSSVYLLPDGTDESLMLADGTHEHLMLTAGPEIKQLVAKTQRRVGKLGIFEEK